ncbi:hypothetical protein A2955_02685 [Candidatus Woesebacteria bacterium RIFCSPLOWO2_01_FULL_37_19]|uniref:Rod shape-determining protein RodA n=2 Tax=Candidatus Woeseibacteriota TaxID=1752722 RepID=A0A1F8AZG6_9BACT|nr:MAG: hypothetical protein A2771_02735 [Candidatus Woesebacteria bacterium RIFCSPHIGHO2_01_FULL_38_26b]OGM57152.1 MAG: hypothetical protein A2955_02685 [Candidatus Woesebacteria bacterium RIFCSPLOWO2_01_FULL_37_19]
MRKKSSLISIESVILFCLVLLSIISTFVLRSIEPALYPQYFIYLILAILTFVIFLKIDFEILEAFSPHLYLISLFALLLPLLIGQVTRGSVRWIQIGSITLQPSELVRPFLLLFFARYLTSKEISLIHLAKVFIFLFIPFLLILIQPSLGVAILTALGFLGVLIASEINKKYIFSSILILLAIMPLVWFILAPYQRQRILTFIDPALDPQGSGYNSIQSMISIGSGKLFGRGLGRGVQTQLDFLPEKHTDFIFAAISEELGFVGSVLVSTLLFIFFICLTVLIENARNNTARAYVSGVFVILLAETLVHIGMNVGLLPITGVPLPIVSAGGSALIGTVMSVAISFNAKK